MINTINLITKCSVKSPYKDAKTISHDRRDRLKKKQENVGAPLPNGNLIARKKEKEERVKKALGIMK